MAQETTVKSFTTNIQVHFGDCDPAGIMYFSRIFDFSHQVFEEFIASTSIGWKGWFEQKDFIVPIKHVACDYSQPLRPGQSYQVEAVVAKISESGFEMNYRFSGAQGPLAQTKMVHVFADSKSMKKASIPPTVREVLMQHLVRGPEGSGDKPDA